jgi:hypothetical protein
MRDDFSAKAMVETLYPAMGVTAMGVTAATNDPINPAHYRDHPSGVECITITEHMTFNVGNAIKYAWRAGKKGDAVQDLRKAIWYLEREITRLSPKDKP